MANLFDQFDKPATAATRANPFDQFDAAAAGSAKPGVVEDVAKSLPVGLAKGTIGLVGFPGTVQQAGNGLIDRIMLGATHKVMDWTGLGPQADTPDRAEFDKFWNTVGHSSNIPTGADIQNGVEKITGPFRKPATVPGHYAETIGEFAPSLAIGSGNMVPRIVGDWLIPAIMSETAGQATKGTKAEPIARLAGGLAGNIGATAVRARASAPERTVTEAAREVTPAEFAAAQTLQNRAAQTGVPLSGPEAIQAVTNGATKLGDVQRVVEGSTAGGTTTSRFYAGRPQQVDAAANRTFDTIAPQDAAPSTLGPRAAAGATEEIEAARRGINAATRPAYNAASTHTLGQADFDPIARDPAFQASLRRLRNDEVLGPVYAAHPDNSVAVIDAVTKDMRDRGVALSNTANPGFSSQTAGMYGTGAAEARDIARDPARGGSQAYDDALTMQAQARRQNLEPLEQGPLGRVANAQDTATAYNAVLPPTPLAGGEHELVDTIMRLGRRDPDTTTALVRQALADRFDKTAGRLVGGENQYGGARFAKDIAGTPQAETNLNAVVGALPSGPVAQPAMQELVDVLRATGMRKPQGSATEFNRQISSELSALPAAATALAGLKTAGVAAATQVGDTARRAWLGRGTNTLADLFLAPDSVDQIRRIAARQTQTPAASMMARQAAQTDSELRR